MAPRAAAFTKETTTTTGTGSVGLGGAPAGFLTFRTALGLSSGQSAQVTYAIETTGAREAGIGTVTANLDGTTTLSRDTVLKSTNGGGKINLAGTSSVYLDVADAPFVPDGHIFGLSLANNATSPLSAVDIAVGSCRASDGSRSMDLRSGLTKSLNASWAAGSGAGGLDTGTKAGLSTYHVYLIGKDDGTLDGLFSLSASAPTMPTGYTHRRRLGAVLTNSGGDILAFAQFGDEFLLGAPPLDLSGAATSVSRTLVALSVPNGIAVDALLRVTVKDTTAAAAVLLTSVWEADSAASAGSGAATLATSAANVVAAWEGRIRTSTARQIGVRATATTPLVEIRTRGWVDTRGK